MVAEVAPSPNRTKRKQFRWRDWVIGASLVATLILGVSVAFVTHAKRLEWSVETDRADWAFEFDDSHGVTVHLDDNEGGFYRPRYRRWQLGFLCIDQPELDADMDDEEWHRLNP